MERKLFAIIVALATNGTIFEEGYVMDAGANDGRSTMQLANLFVGHAVLAMDPLEVNVAAIRKVARRKAATSVEVLHGALGAAHSTLWYDGSAESRAGRQIGKLYIYRKLMTNNLTRHAPVYTVDELFERRRLSFAHWDVEGSEADLLRGAERTVRRDLPVFTVETHRRRSPEQHEQVMSAASALGYVCLTVDEVCGRSDCRNHLCAPPATKSRIAAVLADRSLDGTIAPAA